MVKQRLHKRKLQPSAPIYHSLVSSLSLIGETKPLDLGPTSGVKLRPMTRIAHIIATLFLLATMLGQSAGATSDTSQDMDCCDNEMMQQMHVVDGLEGDTCTQERECPGGDACCGQAIQSAPALMPALAEASSRIFGQALFEMDTLQQPNGAPVASFAQPPIA
ncbi:hypothetical protein SAMN04488071_0609 [Kordiimonas lacus]|uniref:Uncharacterized protein n=2 Tax=Kordiimonas lacus TaxID=637679 RepID=A0A1G6ULH9_9PROT|nr:hypothetical protein SAMN04488071_0609 [Kordiimonas lacus]